jgi:hypothetical protein
MVEGLLSRGWAGIGFILVLSLFGIGLYVALSPRGAVHVSRRWLLKGHVEPGATALILTRLGGIILLLLALILGCFLLVAAFASYWEYGPS